MTNEEKRNIYNNIQNLYNMDFNTWQEVLAMLYNLVADVEQKFEVFEQKFEIMLGKEVTEAIRELYENGKLTEIINEEIFSDLNNKIDKVKNDITIVLTNEVNRINNKIENVNEQLDNMKNKPIISFIFDDGFVEDDKTYKLFKSKNMVCNFALVKDWTKALNKNYVDNYRKYQDEGFGILSHSSTHADLRNEGVSLYTAEYEIKKSLELRKYNFKISGFVAPYSKIHEDYMGYIEQNYDFAFTTYRGVLSGDKKGHYSKKEDVHRLWRISIESNSLEDLKTCIDNCISENGFLVLYGHQLDITTGLTTEKLTALLEYVSTLDCDVLNIYTAMTKYFNININNASGFDDELYENKCIYSSNIELSNSVDYNKLFLYNHNTDNGDNLVIDGNRITLGYTSQLNSGKVSSIQTKIPLSDIDMSYIENQNIVIEADIYTNTINFDNIDFTIEGRFVDSLGANDGEHILHCNLNKSSKKIKTMFTPYTSGNKSYLHLILRTRFDGVCPSDTKIQISNLKVKTVKAVKKDIADLQLSNQTISTLNSNVLINLGDINIDNNDNIVKANNTFKLRNGRNYNVSLVINSDTVLDTSINPVLTLFEGVNVVKRIYPTLISGLKPYIIFNCIVKGTGKEYCYKLNTSKTININTYSYLSINEI